jgi:hypothetical protein
MMINSITKSEYQFLKHCKKHFDYQPPIEVVSINEECASSIPLKQSLSYTLQNSHLLHRLYLIILILYQVVQLKAKLFR